MIAVNQISIFVATCNYLANTEREKHEKNNAANYKCSSKDGIIIQGIFLLPEIRPEWWGAISSCLIALFTLTLWIATDRLWRTSTRHADHIESQLRIMVSVESPVFAWNEFKLDLIQGFATTGIIVADNIYRPTVSVKNAGRSPMDLRGFCIETVFRDDFRPTYDSQPTYNTIVGATFMLEPGTGAQLSAPETLKFNKDEVAMIDDFKRIFWMYGFVRYFNRLSNETWEAGFIQQWDSRGGFVPYSLPNYNYHRPYEAGSAAPIPLRAHGVPPYLSDLHIGKND
jgi:hypothetical protein